MQLEGGTFEKEVAIVRERVPHASSRLASQVTRLVQEIRTLELYKAPGVSETLDWVSALAALERDALDPDAVESTLGVVLKSKEDIDALRGARLTELLQHAIGHDTRHPS